MTNKEQIELEIKSLTEKLSDPDDLLIGKVLEIEHTYLAIRDILDKMTIERQRKMPISESILDFTL